MVVVVKRKRVEAERLPHLLSITHNMFILQLDNTSDHPLPAILHDAGSGLPMACDAGDHPPSLGSAVDSADFALITQDNDKTHNL